MGCKNGNGLPLLITEKAFETFMKKRSACFPEPYKHREMNHVIFRQMASRIVNMHSFVVAVIEDDHLLNATYYSPDIEEPLDSTAMLGNIVHSESPTHVGGTGVFHNGGGGSLHHSHSNIHHHGGGSQSHIDTAASVGKCHHLSLNFSHKQSYFLT